jgi:hypothetical protein
MVELADLGEQSDTFADAVAALKHLENVTEALENKAINLKPQPSITEVSENLQRLLKPFRAN